MEKGWKGGKGSEEIERWKDGHLCCKAGEQLVKLMTVVT